MYRSQQFHKQLKRYEKNSAKLEEAFHHSVPFIPLEMASELFVAIRQLVDEESRPDTLFGDVIDLLHQDYDDRSDPLLPREWDLIRDLVNDFAAELDIALVQYVMERVVERGRINGE